MSYQYNSSRLAPEIQQSMNIQSHPNSKRLDSKRSLRSNGLLYQDYGSKNSSKNPRIARRGKLIAQEPDSLKDKCAICMNQMQEIGKLSCLHQFCLQCLTKWWRKNSTCPICREEINFVTQGNGNKLFFEELPEEVIDQNQPFVPRCELCWGDIEKIEKMNICTICRSIYWHSRCLPFKSNKWYCAECAGQDQEGSL